MEAPFPPDGVELFTDLLQDAESLDEFHRKLLHLARGVCRVELPANRDGTARWGTGFHYGGGWVVTNAHGLTSSEIVAKARFVFFSEDGSPIVFNALPRPGLRVKIASTRRADPTDHTPDLAAVKLGTWTQYGRPESDLDEHERMEQSMVNDLPIFASPPDDWVEEHWDEDGQIVPPQPIYPTVKPNDAVYLLHFSKAPTPGFAPLQISYPGRVTESCDRRIVSDVYSRQAASGSPLLNISLKLVGVHYMSSEGGLSAAVPLPQLVVFLSKLQQAYVPFETYEAYASVQHGGAEEIARRVSRELQQQLQPYTQSLWLHEDEDEDEDEDEEDSPACVPTPSTSTKELSEGEKNAAAEAEADSKQDAISLSAALDSSMGARFGGDKGELSLP
jgi:hypothetical protein